ncbi:MAG: S-layer homology domain-containing protein, partial [Paenibacillaceae bacterium]|nr:S-layer homology domain-containing protein [Paenibacillaceae bacterium]
LVAPSVEFKVTGVYEGMTVEVTTFNAYVERTIKLPEGVDPHRITTGVVVDPDGTVRHVPTRISVVDGSYYATINSLTNSAYSVVWHPLEFADAADHWAKESVNDMGSRMVVEGEDDGLFHPDRNVTRAEFAAIVIRGLGLPQQAGASSFPDVLAADWFTGAVNTAYAYGLIDGMDDGSYRPNDNITREQAMTIVARASEITGLAKTLSERSAMETLSAFADASAVSGWAASSVSAALQADIVNGRGDAELAPQAFMTRAEVAAVIQRLLQRSGLI